MTNPKQSIYRILRWSEKYTRTDMLYLVKSNYWLNLNFISTSILSFTLSVFFANYLSKETFGLYQFVLSSFSIIATFTLTGMNTVITKHTALGLEGTMQKSIRSQFLYGLIPSLISFFVSAWYFMNNNIELSVSFLLMSISIPIITTFNSFNSFLIGKKMFKKHFTYNFIFNITYYGLMIFIVYKNPNLVWLVFGNYLVTSILNYIFYKKTKKHVENDNFSKDFNNSAIHQSISNILPSILTTIDYILIYKILGPSTLAIYSIISAIPTRLFGFIRNITASATPKISTQSEENVRNNISQKVLKFILLGTIVGTFYLIVAEPIFNVFFPTYKEYIKLSYLYIIPAILSVTSSFTSTYFILTQSKKNIYVYNTIYPILSISSVVVGGLYMGIIGVIIGRSIGYLFTIIISLILIKNISIKNQ